MHDDTYMGDNLEKLEETETEETERRESRSHGIKALLLSTGLAVAAFVAYKEFQLFEKGEAVVKNIYQKHKGYLENTISIQRDTTTNPLLNDDTLITTKILKKEWRPRNSAYQNNK